MMIMLVNGRVKKVCLISDLIEFDKSLKTVLRSSKP